MVIESIFSSKNRDKDEKIFIYLDWTARKKEGKGAAATFGKKRRCFLQKK
jgi:hypothetical protein